MAKQSTAKPMDVVSVTPPAAEPSNPAPSSTPSLLAAKYSAPTRAAQTPQSQGETSAIRPSTPAQTKSIRPPPSLSTTAVPSVV